LKNKDKLVGYESASSKSVQRYRYSQSKWLGRKSIVLESGTKNWIIVEAVCLLYMNKEAIYPPKVVAMVIVTGFCARMLATKVNSGFYQNAIVFIQNCQYATISVFANFCE
jgi:hypothetical protein